MPKKNKKFKYLIKRIADSRMVYLFQRAHEIFPDKKELANRYVYLARRYAQRAKIKILLIGKNVYAINVKISYILD